MTELRHIPGSEGRSPSVPYRSSPVFDQDTLPQALQRDHRTKRGVWGVLHVLDGSIRFHREGGDPPRLLAPGCPQLIRPDDPHHLERVGPVRLRVDFFDHEPEGLKSWTC